MEAAVGWWRRGRVVEAGVGWWREGLRRAEGGVIIWVIIFD